MVENKAFQNIDCCTVQNTTWAPSLLLFKPWVVTQWVLSLMVVEFGSEIYIEWNCRIDLESIYPRGAQQIFWKFLCALSLRQAIAEVMRNFDNIMESKPWPSTSQGANPD